MSMAVDIRLSYGNKPKYDCYNLENSYSIFSKLNWVANFRCSFMKQAETRNKWQYKYYIKRRITLVTLTKILLLSTWVISSFLMPYFISTITKILFKRLYLGSFSWLSLKTNIVNKTIVRCDYFKLFKGSSLFTL